MSSRLGRRLKRFVAGFTLIEVMVAIVILAMVSVMMYSAFNGLRRSHDGITRLQDRYHEGRSAMARMTRELQSAYLSANVPIDPSLRQHQTAFIGTRGSPADRVDFVAFAHRRLDRNAHESDQAEISYFGSPNPKDRGVTDLVRRVSNRPDLEPDKGGRVQVLATDIDLFQLDYLDPLTGRFVELWDTTQAVGQANRLPLVVRITLVLNGGARRAGGQGQKRITLTTKVRIPIQEPISFTGVIPEGTGTQ